jgi:hypothetical protein
MNFFGRENSSRSFKPYIRPYYTIFRIKSNQADFSQYDARKYIIRISLTWPTNFHSWDLPFTKVWARGIKVVASIEMWVMSKDTSYVYYEYSRGFTAIRSTPWVSKVWECPSRLILHCVYCGDLLRLSIYSSLTVHAQCSSFQPHIKTNVFHSQGWANVCRSKFAGWHHHSLSLLTTVRRTRLIRKYRSMRALKVIAWIRFGRCTRNSR